MRADDCKTLFDRLAAPLAVRHFAPMLGLSVAAGLAATVLIARSLFLPGLVLLALAPVLDGVAGALARRGGGSPLLAAPLILFLPAFGFALADPTRALAALLLVTGLAILVSLRAAIGQGVDTIKLAVIAAYAAACLFPNWFSVIAYLSGIACFVLAGSTAARRA